MQWPRPKFRFAVSGLVYALQRAGLVCKKRALDKRMKRGSRHMRLQEPLLESLSGHIEFEGPRSRAVRFTKALRGGVVTLASG